MKQSLYWSLVCISFGCGAPAPDVEIQVDQTSNAPVPLRSAAHADDWFRESQIPWIYENGREAGQYTILETVGGGIGIFDFDCDAAPDFICAGGGKISSKTALPTGRPCGLFRQQDSKFVPVAEQANLPLDLDYSHGVTIGDINNDGFPDVLMTCYGADRLLINLGDGTFSDESIEYGLKQHEWSTAAAFGDVDGDGCLDLFIASYVDWHPDPNDICVSKDQRDVCPPQHYPPLPDHFFLNSGDGELLDISAEAGVRRDGKGLGVISGDFDLDGNIDFYVANDAVSNHFYQGWDGKRFREVGEIYGLAFNDAGSPEGSMGVAMGDLDGDQWPDLVVTNFELEDNSVYRNLNGQGFLHETLSYGLGGEGRLLVGFGTCLTDVDSDGWPDLCVLNGHVLYHNGLAPFRQRPLFYRNLAGQRFESVSHIAPWFEQSHAGRGIAVGDLNGDGGPDLAVGALEEPVTLLLNNHPPKSWVSLKLVGTRSPRDAIGARIRTTTLGRESCQFLTSGAGYLSTSERSVIFPTSPQDQLLDIEITWPSGLTESFAGLKTRTQHTIVEGHGEQER